MSNPWATVAGVLIGLAAGVMLLSSAKWFGWDTGLPGAGAMGTRATSDCDGAIEAVVIQFVKEAAEMSGPVYRQLLGKLPADVTVYVVCRDEADFAALKEVVGETACEVRRIAVGHEISTWSRDRWVAMQRVGGGVTLWCAAEEDGASGWPARAGDQRVAMDIADALRTEGVVAQRSGLLFDGGDFVSDERCVLTNARLAGRNVQHTVGDEGELRARLEMRLGKPVVMLGHSPDHHAGMFMATIGEGRVMVGDPSAARGLMSEAEADELVGGADWSRATQEAFDAAGRQCEEAGYEVTRLPVLVGRDGRTWLTGLNVIMDERGGRAKRTVYMPVYAGAEQLNAETERVWRECGFEVERIDCTTTYRQYGSLRCLVNVMRRDTTRDGLR